MISLKYHTLKFVGKWQNISVIKTILKGSVGFEASQYYGNKLIFCLPNHEEKYSMAKTIDDNSNHKQSTSIKTITYVMYNISMYYLISYMSSLGLSGARCRNRGSYLKIRYIKTHIFTLYTKQNLNVKTFIFNTYTKLFL